MAFDLTGLTLDAGDTLAFRLQYELDSNEAGAIYVQTGASEGTLAATAAGSGTVPKVDKEVVWCELVTVDNYTAVDDFYEFGAIMSNGGGRISDVEFNVIPEPATLGMVATFGCGILFIRRRFML